jgi:uncharacterized protein (UPF0261 family)
MLDSEGEPFWNAEADQACYDSIKQNVGPDVPVIEMDHNINDPEFADKCAELLIDMLEHETEDGS